MLRSAVQAHSLGSYQIVRKLGTGGMAEVFLAAQHMPGDVERPVVIKAILPHLAEDDHFVKMFMREARVAALLSHPNIVHIHDVAVIDGRPCMVMEFLRGRDFWHVLQRLGRERAACPPAAAAAVVAQVASGLDYAHRWQDEKGRSLDLVHRDISPHNVFLTREGHVRVLDFGVAKSAYQQQRTDTGILKGKLPYMAPEQAQSQEIDGRADQFALGVILWEALAGARLFARDDPFQTMNALMHLEVPRPSSLRPGAPADLEAVCLRALQRDPTDRFSNCEDFAHALRAWLRTVSAPPEPRLVREILERTIPSSEDAAFYGTTADSVPPSGRTGSGAGTEPQGYDHTPSHSGVAAKPQPGGAPLGSPTGPTVSAGPAAPTSVLPAPLSVAPAPPPAWRRPGALGGAAVAGLVLLVLMVVALSGGDEPVSTALEPVSPPVVAAPTPAAPAPVGPVTVTFTGVPEGIVLEVDGAPLPGATLRVMPSDASHLVRAMRDGREVWRYDGIFQAELTVPLPELPAPASPPAGRVATMKQRPRSTTVRASMRRAPRTTMRRGRLGNGIDIGYP